MSNSSHKPPLPKLPLHPGPWVFFDPNDMFPLPQWPEVKPPPRYYPPVDPEPPNETYDEWRNRMHRLYLRTI